MPEKPEASPQPWWDADFFARIENQASWAYAERGICWNPAHMEHQPTCHIERQSGRDGESHPVCRRACHEPRVCMSCSFLVATGVKQ